MAITEGATSHDETKTARTGTATIDRSVIAHLTMRTSALLIAEDDAGVILTELCCT